ncbi:MAG: lipoprotein [Pseudomonadota bacterium]
MRTGKLPHAIATSTIKRYGEIDKRLVRTPLSVFSRTDGRYAVSTFRFVPVTLFFIALAACGQKGPLYLPDEAPVSSTEQPADDVEPTDEDERQ